MVMTQEELEFAAFIIKEARVSLDEDKQLRKDNLALRAEVERLRVKLARTQTELDRVGRARAVGGEL